MDMVVSLSGALTSGLLQSASINQEAEAAQRRADAEAKEINRLRQEEVLRAQEERADRVRAADEQAARVIVAMSETGGIGGGNVGRFLGEVGGAEGLDLARIAGDASRRDAALASEGAALRRETKLQDQNLKLRAVANTLGMFNDAAGAVNDELVRQESRKSGLDIGKTDTPSRPPSAPSRFVGVFEGGL